MPGKDTTEEQSWEEPLRHVEEIKRFLENYAGKEGYNPYFIIREEIKPLMDRYHVDGERSEELRKAMLALKETPPTLAYINNMLYKQQRKSA